MPEEQDQPKHKMLSKGKKIALIIVVCFIGLLALVYAIGAFFFSSHLYPNTVFATHDVSWESQEEFSQELDVRLDDYALNIQRKGFDCTLTAEQAQLSMDNQQQAEKALSSQNIWLWPLEVFKSHDLSQVVEASFNQEVVKQFIEEHVQAYNAEAIPSENAAIVYDEASDTCVIEDEVYGDQINQDALFAKASDCLSHVVPVCEVTDGELIKPTIVASDERFTQALETVQKLTAGEIPLTLNGSVDAGTVTKELVVSWITYDENLIPSLNADKVNAWAQETTAGFNTVGTQRTYTRPDGKNITVSGGTYGWEVDVTNLGETIIANLNAGKFDAIDVPCKQNAYAYKGKGRPDWGAYVDIDISQQKVRYYDASGILVHSCDCVTGEKGVNDTPAGIYRYNYDLRQSPGLLTGRNDAGEIIYETKVAYWMPFVRNSIGLHDATWQSAFGGNRYDIGYGSHGCINISLEDAKWFYQNLKSDVCVITHY